MAVPNRQSVSLPDITGTTGYAQPLHSRSSSASTLGGAASNGAGRGPRRRLLLPPRETPIGHGRRAEPATEATKSLSGAVEGTAVTRLPHIALPSSASRRASTPALPSAAEYQTPTNTGTGTQTTTGAGNHQDRNADATEETSSAGASSSERGLPESTGGKYIVVKPWGPRVRSHPDFANPEPKPAASSIGPSNVASKNEPTPTHSAPPQPVTATLCTSPLRALRSHDKSITGHPYYAAPFAPAHAHGYATMPALDDPFLSMVSEASHRRLCLLAALSMEPGKATTFVPLPLLRFAAMGGDGVAAERVSVAAPSLGALQPLASSGDHSVLSTLRSVEAMRTLLDSIRPLIRRRAREVDEAEE
ncbi:hypothetical protein HDU90_002056 [Geranomyces variabilis]|nr:hypothetical protein HDU90_002056 [Geranomyces variabilis]